MDDGQTVMFGRMAEMSKTMKDGPASKIVRKNVRRLRGNRTYAATVRDMRELASHSIHEVVLKRIESGERRIDVDDLIGLALAFQVTPAELLLDYGDEPDDLVEISGDSEMPELIRGAERWKVYEWLRGRRPIWADSDDDVRAFRERISPAWADPAHFDAGDKGSEPNMDSVYDSQEFKQAVRRAILGE